MLHIIIRTPELRDHAATVIRALPITEPPQEVVIREYKSRRTLEANNYYWARLREIEEQAWLNKKKYHADVWHEYFKREFLGIIDLPDGGLMGISTASLDVPEFNNYTEQVIAFGAGLGVKFAEKPW